MEKRCGRCEAIKGVEQFHRSKRGDGFQSWCKTCRKTYDAAYHRATLARRRARRAERKREFVAWYRALKEARPCADCGGRFPAESMQWDHRPGVDKLTEVANLVRRLCKRRILEEIEKCDLVCANCHAVRTVSRRDISGCSSAW